VARQAEWEKQQASEKKRRENAIKKGKPGKKVREDWSHEEHSLAALCNANPDFANKVRIVQEGGPHVINLLDDFDF
jgi:hypothetical protein